MQSLYISMVYVALLALGCTAPFVFSLGYVWIDAFEPQVISPLLAAIPVALIMGVAAFGSYLTMDRKFPPKQWAMIALMLVMAAWVTITTTWAVAGDWAWVKWDWALKTIVFAAFIPFVFRSRVQIEAFIQVYVISLGVNIIPFAIKTLISGSAYGRNLGASVGVGELSESSTLAAVAVMCVPLSLCWVEHSLLVPFPRLRRWAYYGYACVCLLCAVGTYARTGLVAMALLGVAMWFQTKRKVLLGAFMALAVVVGGAYTAASWQERMMTIESYNDDGSALGRILVWKWTLGFVADHPLGGGFNSYVVNRIEFPPLPGSTDPVYFYGKAFHNIFFEVLGEHGWPGLALYLLLFAMSTMKLWTVWRGTRKRPELAWCHDLARALLTSLAIMTVSGQFIGVAFQPMIWYLFAASVTLSSYFARARAGEATGSDAALGGWRAGAIRPWRGALGTAAEPSLAQLPQR